MKIRWTQDVEFEVVTDYILATDEVISKMISFLKSDESEVNKHSLIISQYTVSDPSIVGGCDLQFEDGSMAYAIPVDWFEEIA